MYYKKVSSLMDAFLTQTSWTWFFYDLAELDMIPSSTWRQHQIRSILSPSSLDRQYRSHPVVLQRLRTCWHGRGHSSIGNAAGMKTAGIRALENSISINAGFKVRLDIEVSVFSLSSKREVLKFNLKGTQGLAARSIHESLLCSSVVCFSADQTGDNQCFAEVL